MLEHAFDEPDAVFETIRVNSPYWPIARYAESQSEIDSLRGGAKQGERAAAPAVVPAWFRGDLADSKPLVHGLEPVWDNERFVEAAARVSTLTDPIVRPQLVYANLMGPTPFTGPAHTDVAAFRGIDRSRYPVWLLGCMARSGQFEKWQRRVITAVTWFHEGEGGEFHYWPEGLDRPRATAPAEHNTAIVGDNDVMFHQVAPIGDRDAPFRSFTLTSELYAEPGGWSVRDGGETLAWYEHDEVRVSISWKAEVFADDEERRVVDDHLDDLDEVTLVKRLRDALAARGLAYGDSPDLLHDPDFVDALSTAFPLPTLGPS